MPWRAGQVGVENGYQYNGIERNEDFGLNADLAEFRSYDAAVGRWWQVDPLAEKYFPLSPYGYVANNPLIFVDPFGLELYLANNNNLQQAINDIMGLVNNANFNGKVTFKFTDTERGKKVDVNFNDLSETEINGDAGLTLLKNVTSSSKKYLYEVGEKVSAIDRESGEVTGIYNMGSPTNNGSLGLNISITDRGDKPRFEIPLFTEPYKVLNGVPKNGFDAHIVISPYAGNGKQAQDGDNIPRGWFAFHELQESYYRTNGGQNYKDAHGNAQTQGVNFYLTPSGWSQRVINPYAPEMKMSEIRKRLNKKN